MNPLCSICAVLLVMTMTPAPAWAGVFDDRGVWNPVSGATLAGEAVVSFGPIDVSDRERELSFTVSGNSGDDSLTVKIDLYGMMSANASDTTVALEVFSGTYRVVTDAVTIADTLSGANQYPYLFGRLTNVDADSSIAGVDAWLYMRPRELLFIGAE